MLHDDEPRDFGSKLKELRLAAGLSQERLAERARLSVQAIGALERGDRKVPYRDTIARLVEALTLTPGQQRDLEIAAGTRRGLPRRTAASRTTAPGTMPTPLTPLIGREDNLVQIEALLRAVDVRLVTLTGAAGIGKTRLALHAAAGIAGDFEHGTCSVALAPVKNAADVESEIALALHLTVTGAASSRETLFRYLEMKESLLVLDNFEHVIDAASNVTELLERCPRVTVLVTSREALRLPAEHEYVVPPLREPSAIELFVDRATAVNPKFSLVPRNSEAVAEVCRRLDGLPLALELAAPLTRLASPAQLIEWMEPLRLDVGDVFKPVDRHSTMRSAISWSYDLLHESERHVFLELTIFAGGWDLEGARSVCKTAGETDAQLLRALAALLDKSLLQQWELDSGVTRMGMLETIRQFGRERLSESSVAFDLGQRHAEYYLMLSAQADAGMMSADQANWHERLDAEIGNLRAALEWARAHEAFEIGLKIATALRSYWERRGLIAEGRRWLDEFLALSPSTGNSSEVIVDALLAAGILADRQDDYAAAQRRLDRASGDARSLGYQRGVARAASWLGSIPQARGDYASAVSLFEESLAIWREIGDPFGTANALNRLAAALRDCEEMDASIAMFEESLAVFRSLRVPTFIAQVLANLGKTERLRGNADRAAVLLNESLKIRRQLGDQWGTAVSLAWLGDVACSVGDFTQADRYYRESFNVNQSTGIREINATLLEGFGRIACARGEPARAVRLWSAAAEERKAIGLLFHPADRAMLDNDIQAASTRLGDQAYEAAWLEGAVRPLDELFSAT